MHIKSCTWQEHAVCVKRAHNRACTCKCLVLLVPSGLLLPFRAFGQVAWAWCTFGSGSLGRASNKKMLQRITVYIYKIYQSTLKCMLDYRDTQSSWRRRTVADVQTFACVLRHRLVIGEPAGWAELLSFLSWSWHFLWILGNHTEYLKPHLLFSFNQAQDDMSYFYRHYFYLAALTVNSAVFNICPPCPRRLVFHDPWVCLSNVGIFIPWYYVTKQGPLLSDCLYQRMPLRDNESIKALLALGSPCPTGVGYNLYTLSVWIREGFSGIVCHEVTLLLMGMWYLQPLTLFLSYRTECSHEFAYVCGTRYCLHFSTILVKKDMTPSV